MFRACELKDQTHKKTRTLHFSEILLLQVVRDMRKYRYWASKVIVDESKMCDGLGPGFPLPVEIVPFCHEHTMRLIADLPALKGCEPVPTFAARIHRKEPEG